MIILEIKKLSFEIAGKQISIFLVINDAINVDDIFTTSIYEIENMSYKDIAKLKQYITIYLKENAYNNNYMVNFSGVANHNVAFKKAIKKAISKYI